MTMDTVPKFQYPCYADVCTFPDQFCNSDPAERRCNPCSEYLCQQTRRPLACQYFCLKRGNGNNPPGAIQPYVNPWTLEGSNQFFLLLIYCAVVTTFIFVLLIVFLTNDCIRRHKPRQLSKSKNGSVQETATHTDASFPADDSYAPLLRQPGLSNRMNNCVTGAGATPKSDAQHRNQTPPPSYSRESFSANGAETTVNPSLTTMTIPTWQTLTTVSTNTDSNDTLPLPSGPDRSFHTNVTNEQDGRAEKPWRSDFRLEDKTYRKTHNTDDFKQTELKEIITDRTLAPRT